MNLLTEYAIALPRHQQLLMAWMQSVRSTRSIHHIVSVELSVAAKLLVANGNCAESVVQSIRHLRLCPSIMQRKRISRVQGRQYPHLPLAIGWL